MFISRSSNDEDILNYFYYLVPLQFIDERIAALNSGAPIDDEFEKEIRVNEMKSSKTSHLVCTNFGFLKNLICSFPVPKLHYVFLILTRLKIWNCCRIIQKCFKMQ